MLLFILPFGKLLKLLTDFEPEVTAAISVREI